MHYFSFKYWPLVWLFFIGFCFAWYWWCLKPYCVTRSECCNLDRYYYEFEKLEQRLDSCCNCLPPSSSGNNQIQPEHSLISRAMPEVPQPPLENCRVHFSGGVIGAEQSNRGVSKVYTEDLFSECVGSGSYSSNRDAFPKAVKNTFDGIAIDQNTRLILFSDANFSGDVLVDVTGPAIINNVIWKDEVFYRRVHNADYPNALQAKYPQSVRQWSSANMHAWSYGSCKIVCN
jgi:hypothetical protein